MNFYRSSPTQPRALPSGWLMALALFSLMVLLVPGIAHAADLFTVPATDQSKILFLDKIFGDFSASPLAGPVSVFNSAILFVGGILAAYTIIAGTMSTAHDGEMLGKKWSSMWIPIRTAIGTAAILPVLNGFCVAQSIVLWLATQGVGLADAVWNQFAANPVQSMSVTSGALGDKVSQMALAMLQSNLCVQTYTQVAQLQQSAAASSGQSTLGSPTFAVTPITSSNGNSGIGYQYGETSGSDGVGASALCGQVFLGTSTPTTPASTNISSADALSTDAITNSAAVNTAQSSQFQALQSSMSSAASSFLANSNFNVLGAVTTASNTYSTAMLSAAQAAASDPNALSAFRQDVQQDGWAFAGAWYMKLIRMQDQISGALNRTPSVQTPSGSDSIVNNNGQVDSEMAKLNTVIHQTSAQSGTGLDKAAMADMNFDSNSSTALGKLSDLISWFTGSMKSAASAVVNPQDVVAGKMTLLLNVAGTLNDPTKNGLLAAKNLGDNIIWMGWTIAAAGLVVGFFAGASVGLVFGAFAFSLWTIGAGLAVVLPMTPFIMWVGIMIGWLIQVVEAVFAAPLWAVVHIHPDGDGVVGRGGAGYSLVLALTLRPALMIMGLISAIVLMDPITYFLNSIFFGAFRLMEGNTVTGPVTVVAVCAMYCSSLFMVIRKTFSLIHVIPDQILNWIGNGAPSLGGSAQEAANKAQEGHQSIIAGVGRMGSHGVQAGSALRQIAQQRKTTEAQQQGNIGDMAGRFTDGAMDASLAANKARQQDPEHRAEFLGIAGQKMDRALREGTSLQKMDDQNRAKGGYTMGKEDRSAVDQQVATLSTQRSLLRDEEKAARQARDGGGDATEAPGSSILGADGNPIGGDRSSYKAPRGGNDDDRLS